MASFVRAWVANLVDLHDGTVTGDQRSATPRRSTSSTARGPPEHLALARTRNIVRSTRGRIASLLGIGRAQICGACRARCSRCRKALHDADASQTTMGDSATDEAKLRPIPFGGPSSASMNRSGCGRPHPSAGQNADCRQPRARCLFPFVRHGVTPSRMSRRRPRLLPAMAALMSIGCRASLADVALDSLRSAEESG